MAKRVKIPGRLESAETGGIVTGTEAVMDDEKGKTQVVINSEVDAAIINLAQGKQDNLTFDSAPTEDSPNPVTSAGVYTAEKVLSDAIEAILLLIPSAASALNKLVDMQTMNSSIATATASFKGTYNLVSDLHLGVDATHEQVGAALDALSLGADNNDYAFVQVPNSATAPTEISKTERYKFNGTNWLFEYDLNNSGFTQGQWNAINSGVTSLLVGKLSDLPTNAELTTLLAGKQDNLTFDNVPTAGSPNPVKSGGVYARNNEIVALINALDVAKQDVLTFDNAPVEGSPNPVKSGGVYTAISAVQAAIVALDAAKQNVLTFDRTPALGSTNPVTSSGIKTELNRIDGNITTLNDLYEALTQSALVVVQPTDTWPVANPEEQTIYRVVDRVNTPPQYYSDYMWNGTTMVLMAEYDNAIDPRPKKASQNLVTSGGVFDNMGALDVSELNSTENPHTLAQYVDLSAALAAIPIDYQKGGMSIKFIQGTVQSSDHKYVHYRLTKQVFSTNTKYWNVYPDVYEVESTWINALIDGNGKFIKGIKSDRRELNYLIQNIDNPIIEEKDIDDDRFVRALLTSNNKFITGIKRDGEVIISKAKVLEYEIDNPIIEEKDIDNDGFVRALLTNNKKFIAGIKRDGEVIISKAKILEFENAEHNSLYNKKISVLGDSISTFAYSNGNIGDFSGCEKCAYVAADTLNNGGVNAPNKTWWGQLIERSGAVLNYIRAIGGGSVTGEEGSEPGLITNMSVKYNELFSNGLTGDAPDVIFVFLGTNDINWTFNIGQVSDFQNGITTSFYGAYINLINNLELTYPLAKIILLTPMFSAWGGIENPIYIQQEGNGHPVKYIRDIIIECANLMAVPYIDLYSLVNVNRYNYGNFYRDVLHPKVEGMTRIAEAIYYNV